MHRIELPRPPENLELLYSYTPGHPADNEAFIKRLSDDPGPSGERFRRYREHLRNIATIAKAGDPAKRSEITTLLTNLLKQIYFDTLTDHNFRENIPIELCVSGSLARREPTPYSDIDCFIVFSEEATPAQKSAVNQLAHKIFGVMNGLFYAEKQFSLDPVGISLHRLNGTVTELLGRIADDPNQELLLANIIGSRSIFGKEELLNELRNRLIQQHKNIITPDFYFSRCISEFTGPAPNATEILLKPHLIRPIDFAIQGFKFSAQLPLDMDYQKILSALEDKGKIDPIAGMVMRYIKDASFNVREFVHVLKKEEHETVPINHTTGKMMYFIAWIRASLDAYLKANPQPKTFTLIPGLYLTHGVYVKEPPYIEFHILNRLTEAITKLQQLKSPEVEPIIKGLTSYRPIIINRMCMGSRYCIEFCSTRMHEEIDNLLRTDIKDSRLLSFMGTPIKKQVADILLELKNHYSNENLDKEYLRLRRP